MNIFKKRTFITIGLVGLLLVILAVSGCSKPAPVELNVSAAASLTDALTAINAKYMQENAHVSIVANFASSGILQKQIEQGAPADVFISAAAKQMQALQDGGLIINETRQNLLNNRVVLVVPSDSTLNITSFMDLLNDDVKHIAIGDPEFVPSGIYGKQAFEVFGIYEKIQAKLVLQMDTPHVLGFIESGNVEAGIVYSTDAALSDKIKIVANAPDEVNSKIVYPIAVIKSSQNVDAAKNYIAFLLSEEAKAIFEQYGFIMVIQ